MNELDKKINKYFSGTVVRKDLVRSIKEDTIIPSYVLEYLLGQYCKTSDETGIQAGVERVKTILSKHYANRNEDGLIRSNIREQGRYKVIDKISVTLNDKDDVHEAEFANLGLKKVPVDSGIVRAYPRFLVSSVWCIADVEYKLSEDNQSGPWSLSSLKPIQLLHFDFDAYIATRGHFNTDEWLDLLMQSIGLNPEMFGRRSKLTHLIRLIPFCERNYNLIELGPKGTGKSHVYSEISPYGILVSGDEVTMPKLFVDNANGKIGLVGYWDCVAFDEFADRQKCVDQDLVDITKNYMSNKSFSRDVEVLGAQASMIFLGNTQHTVSHMLKHSNLFCELPEKFYDSTFLNRIHFYVPGWEMDVIRGEMFSEGYGLVADYLAEVLQKLRNDDYSDLYKEHFALSANMSARDRDSINKTFSGLMKIIFPHKKASSEEMEELLRFAIEGRKRVKDQLMRIDATYGKVHFAYFDSSGTHRTVTTAEEQVYPRVYHRAPVPETIEDFADVVGSASAIQDVPQNTMQQLIFARSLSMDLFPATFPVSVMSQTTSAMPTVLMVQNEPVPKEEHLTFEENKKGLSFETLFSPYLKGATKVTVTDPYIRQFYQLRNFMELLEVIIRAKAENEEVAVHLITVADDFKAREQINNFEKMRSSAIELGVYFTWEFDSNGTIHARHIVTNHGWKITLDRGLDIFQPYDLREAFNFVNRMQQCRSCKAFEVTFIKIGTN